MARLAGFLPLDTENKLSSIFCKQDWVHVNVLVLSAESFCVVVNVAENNFTFEKEGPITGLCDKVL